MVARLDVPLVSFVTIAIVLILALSACTGAIPTSTPTAASTSLPTETQPPSPAPTTIPTAMATPPSTQTPPTATPADGTPLTFDIVAQYGGAVQAVAVDGDVAYLGVGPRLLALDIGSPSSPQLLGESDVLAGDHLFAQVGDDALVLDVADPTRIRQRGTITGTRWINEMTRADETLLISAWEDGAYAYDVSTPTAPRPRGQVGSEHLEAAVYDVAGGGDRALVGAGGLAVVDLTAPDGAQVVGRHRWPDPHQGGYVVAGAGDVAVVVGGIGDGLGLLRRLDVREPAAPQVVGEVELPLRAIDATLDDGHAYVVGRADDGGVLSIVDIVHSPPGEVARSEVPAPALAVHLVDTRLYVAAGESGLWVFDVREPSAPHVVGRYDTPGRATGLAVRDDLVYVGDGSGGLMVLRGRNAQ